MRVLLTVDAVGGVWTYAVALATALAPRGVQTTFALLGPHASASQLAQVADVPGAKLVATGQPLDWLAAGPAEVAHSGRIIAELARAEGADLLHLNQPSLAAGLQIDMPMLAVAHSCVGTWWEAVRSGSLPADLAWQADLFRAGLVTVDRVVVPSQAFADQLTRYYQLTTVPTVVHNGAQPQSYARKARVNSVLTAGRLWDPGKDVSTLDRAAALIGVPFEAAGPDVGPHGERIACTDVRMLGTLDQAQLWNKLSARPVFVSAARYEPFGLAVLEAAQAGCALVLSDIPAFRELWDGAALFVSPGDAQEFADGVQSLIADPAWRDQQGDRAGLRASRFSAEAMAEHMSVVYDELRATPTRSAAQRAA